MHVAAEVYVDNIIGLLFNSMSPLIRSLISGQLTNHYKEGDNATNRNLS